MDTPLFDFIKEYNESGNLRFHMPGHKGKDIFSDAGFDITEIDGTGVLYHGNGVLSKSQENASVLFSTAKTLYSAEGSSLAIRGMLALIKIYAGKQGKKPVVAAGRNAHKVFMTASAILGIGIDWLYPEIKESLLSAVITPHELERFLLSKKEKPVAVYVTSPDYLGNISDIKGLSEVCKKYGVILAVDNAHGAYLNFLGNNIHPINLGADLCCDSAHKTLSVLTGGAYLHISKNAPEEFSENAQKAMSLFASTSPSFLILSCLDKVNAYLDGEFRGELCEFTEKLGAVKDNLSLHGYKFIGDEPLKLTVKPKEYGYTGEEFNEILVSKNITAEFYDPDHVVFMFTPKNGFEELRYFEKVMLGISRREPIYSLPPVIKELKRGTELEKAVFMPSVTVNVSKAVGRILASPSVSCPPAIPIAVCGEVLDENAVECFRYYGIENIEVIEE